MTYSVLVVDDNRIMRQMVMRAVHLSGLPLREVDGAENGQHALEILRQRHFDLVLLDINMPVMDGETFLSTLRQEAPLAAIPVIIVSTEGSQPRIERLKALGAVFIHKPFRPEELVAAAQKLLGKP